MKEKEKRKYAGINAEVQKRSLAPSFMLKKVQRCFIKKGCAVSLKMRKRYAMSCQCSKERRNRLLWEEKCGRNTYHNGMLHDKNSTSIPSSLSSSYWHILANPYNWIIREYRQNIYSVGKDAAGKDCSQMAKFKVCESAPNAKLTKP